MIGMLDVNLWTGELHPDIPHRKLFRVGLSHVATKMKALPAPNAKGNATLQAGDERPIP